MAFLNALEHFDPNKTNEYDKAMEVVETIPIKDISKETTLSYQTVYGMKQRQNARMTHYTTIDILSSYYDKIVQAIYDKEENNC